MLDRQDIEIGGLRLRCFRPQLLANEFDGFVGQCVNGLSEAVTRVVMQTDLTRGYRVGRILPRVDGELEPARQIELRIRVVTDRSAPVCGSRLSDGDDTDTGMIEGYQAIRR